MKRAMTRGERNIAWIEANCRIPEGKFVGKPVVLRPWQRKIVRGIYDTPTRRAIVSFGRKNAKTALAAFLLLLHLCGPEARANSQLNSDAQSVEQAGVLFRLAAKIVRMSPELSQFVGIRDTVKQLFCEELGTLYRALSSDAPTALGLSPVFAVHDELGQVRGPMSELYEAIETAMGAHEDPLSIVISTQAPNDGDLLSILIDDAESGKDKRTKLFMFSAPMDVDPFSDKAIKAANPAFGDFLNADEVRDQAATAKRMPSREASFRNLILNQRVEARSPFVAPSVWKACGGSVTDDLTGKDVFCGLDLSAVNDLTALVAVVPDGEVWDLVPTFWLPTDGLAEKSRMDRQPYDVWHRQGFLETTPGSSIEYEFVAEHLRGLFDRCNVRGVAFDRWGMKFLKPWLERVGFSPEELERFIEFGQGYVSMSPALREFESRLLNGKVRHGMHPVLTMCAANARVDSKDGINRKFMKAKTTGRIDGMVAAAMGISAAASALQGEGPSIYETRGLVVLGDEQTAIADGASAMPKAWMDYLASDPE
jgi:phage terminase large subunit-like protein